MRRGWDRDRDEDVGAVGEVDICLGLYVGWGREMREGRKKGKNGGRLGWGWIEGRTAKE